MLRGVLAIVLSTILAQVAVVMADLPVHCLRHQVQGQWEFSLGSLSGERPSCGHKHPDAQDAEPALRTLGDGGATQATSKLTVNLNSPDHARSPLDSMGTFTMIYDEGFEVVVEGKTFFAFSRFDMVNGQNQTHCGETLTGWYRDNSQNLFGCYWGKKTDFDERASDARTATKSGLLTSQQRLQQGELDFALPAATPSSESSLSDVKFDALNDDLNRAFDAPLDESFHNSVVSSLNAAVTGDHELIVGTLLQQGLKTAKASTGKKLWTAKAHQMLMGKSVKEINRMAGLKRNMKLEHVHRQQHRHRRNEHKMFTNSSNVFLQRAERHYRAVQEGKRALGRVGDEYSSQDATAGVEFLQVGSTSKFVQKNIYGLPNEWDWSEHGVLDDVINQGDCGSCYTVSTVRMLSARNRIKQGNPNLDPFSISFPLHCAEYNQGCDGGYAFLQSKWSEDVGLVPARCMPYDTRGSCDANSKAVAECAASSGGRYKATNHRYVGGYYGGSDEEEMMKELVHNGPVVVSFEPKDDFMYYNSGIYTSADGDRIHQEWERVDHAVLLVGYGEDKESNKKYWKVQNSWGKDWGENGFFRILRGDNDSGIESISVAADVEKDTGGNVDFFLQTM